jgi:ribose/xylose/arabinose/galactoside ABC-type transport system permease subunit
VEATKKLNGKAVGKWLSNNAIIIMMLAVTLIVGIIHPNFFSGTNMINLFKNVSIRYIIALGISGCLITTGNDLSAGRLAGFAACLACIFAQTEGASGKFYPNMPTISTPLVFVLVIAICAVIGLCNGLVVSYLKVQPFIATLGMQQVVYGICLVYTGGTPIGSLNSNFTALAKDTFLAIPVLIWIALIVAVCFWFLYNKTRHGKYMYAIGGNEAAAEVAGVNVNATKIRIYILASCMFGLAGCLLAAKSGGASVNTAMGYELDAIAACTIGGVSTTGGVGTVPGVLVGVLVFELMKVALQFMNVNSSYTYIVQGLVIIVATVDSKTGKVLAGPDLVSRGFVYVRENESLMDGAQSIVENALERCVDEHVRDWNSVKTRVREALSSYIYRRTKRSPMILPILMEV